MSILQALDIGLAVLVLAVAAWTIFAREAFAAVVAFVAYGLLLSLVWVRLFAVDVALTEAAIGSGVTGVLLIGAAGRLRQAKKSAASEQPSKPLRVWAFALCVLVTLALAVVVLSLPDPAPTLAPEAAQNLAGTGLGEGRACPRGRRGMVSCTRPLLGRRSWNVALSGARRHSRSPCPVVTAARNTHRRSHRLGRRR